MFDFMRKKKDVQSELDVPTVKPKDKERSRRASLMSPVRPRSFKKRDRPMSGSFIPSDGPLPESTVARPSCSRAHSSTASSINLRNPFLDDAEPSMSASQLDLTRSMGSSYPEPPMANIRHVARGSPIIVHPQGEFAEVIYPQHTEADGVMDPFADEHALDRSHSGIGQDEISEESTMTQKTPTKRRRRGSSSAVFRKPVDYLHVNIPVTVFSPPLSVSRQEMWARV
ncbi:uncharacterized protein C8Q71DRAFT_735021 [Rhodofomes roseus]|uniref:Uncharacterized protein n=1 Tax=Rhodofomes roseus TaxID=34475 RepID=A0ABQ8KV16_9APHY|nr:uncharacterized protein C8Q71DRAFT_735021 [Rhodofomes roseus]KAH9842895.1 hypothetical protein C8Q71DRAFT_735021 [Rhodofomes roseus]